jgi:hypothetical protein
MDTHYSDIFNNKLLQIALNEQGELVSIYRVKSGLDCNCICPNCKSKLVAKNKGKTSNETLKPNQKRAHFAHYNAPECSGAAESALHYLAKEILKERKNLLLPGSSYNRQTLFESTFVKFDEVLLEQRVKINNRYIIPDAILVKNGKQLFIEFYKTHIVDDEKIKLIKATEISCLEIDLNFIDAVVEGEVNRDGIIEILEIVENYKYWIYNKKELTLRQKAIALEESIARAEEIRKLKEEEEIKQEDYNRLKKWENIRNYKIRSEEEKKNYKEKGISIFKIYKATVRHTGIVYCPKEKANGNKIEEVELVDCRNCIYYFKDYADDFVKGNQYSDGFIKQTVACGFYKKLTKSSIKT